MALLTQLPHYLKKKKEERKVNCKVPMHTRIFLCCTRPKSSFITFMFNFRRKKDRRMVVMRDEIIMCRSCADELGCCYNLSHGISLYAVKQHQINMQHLVVKVCISVPVVYFGLISNLISNV